VYTSTRRRRAEVHGTIVPVIAVDVIVCAGALRRTDVCGTHVAILAIDTAETLGATLHIRHRDERAPTRGFAHLKCTWVAVIFARYGSVLAVHRVWITGILGTGVPIITVRVLVYTEATQAGIAEVKGTWIIVTAGDRWMRTDTCRLVAQIDRARVTVVAVLVQLAAAAAIDHRVVAFTLVLSVHYTGVGSAWICVTALEGLVKA
jgi:hypothetical protein